MGTLIIGNTASSPTTGYGFEEGTDPGSGESMPNYILGATSNISPDFAWTSHLGSVKVATSGAYAGANCLYRGMCPWSADSVLGATPMEGGTAANIGANNSYPSGYGNHTQLSPLVLTETTIRFAFKCAAHWHDNYNHDLGSGYLLMKFVANHGSSSARSILLMGAGTADPENTLYTFQTLEDRPEPYLRAGIDLQDGNWHTLSLHQILDPEAEELDVEIWWDDWDMAGDPDHTDTLVATSMGDRLGIVRLIENFASDTPALEMGIYFDQFELWDGLPTSGGAGVGRMTLLVS